MQTPSNSPNVSGNEKPDILGLKHSGGDNIINQIIDAAARVAAQIESATRTVDNASQRVQQAAQTAKDVTRDTPFAPLLIAGVIGFALGAIWSRR